MSPGVQHDETQREGHGRDRELRTEMTGKLEGPVRIRKPRHERGHEDDPRRRGQGEYGGVSDRRLGHRQEGQRSEQVRTRLES